MNTWMQIAVPIKFEEPTRVRFMSHGEWIESIVTELNDASKQWEADLPVDFNFSIVIQPDGSAHVVDDK